MLRAKVLSLLFVGLLAVGLAWPQHGPPGLTPNRPAHGGPGLSDSGGAVASVYADATACWSFNAQDGTDDCAATYGLTEVNTPKYKGGALGYAADFEQSSVQYSTNTPGWDLTDEDFLVCAWVSPESTGTAKGIAGEDNVTHRNWAFYLATNEDVYGYIFNGADQFKQWGNANECAVGNRCLVCMEHDAVNNNLTIWSSGSGSLTSTSLTGGTGGGMQTDPAPGTIGLQGNANEFDGALGPLWIWDGSYNTADITTLYNSGKGYTCADAPTLANAAEHCYEMSEDGGPYADSIGSVDMTGVNTPTRAAGLVERSDSGMSLATDNTTRSRVAGQGGSFPQWGGKDFTVVGWYNPRDIDAAASQYLWNKDNNSGAGVEWSVQQVQPASGGAIRGKCCGQSTYVTGDTVVAGDQGSWFYIAFGYDSAAGKEWMRVNAETTVTQAITPSGTGGAADVQIGGWSVTGGASGASDNVAFWARKLTDAELDTLWNSGAGTFYTWMMDTLWGDPLRLAWNDPKMVVRRTSR